MADACQPIIDRIEVLNEDVEKLEGVLTEVLPSSRAGIRKLIKADRDKIALQTKKLAACRKKHPLP